ncbi:hypothetical protein [Burkholderia pseudomallei]|jgi:hypothetical protein|uniref:hypothetical protein n=1 Tax=Burkholderia pseudomallei TaxID=28450 RepID=UPI0024DFE191|nr:hypothetical protein [Burkholderia pseudomallei]
MKMVKVNGTFNVHQTMDVNFDAIKRAYRDNASVQDVLSLLAFKLREELCGDGDARLVPDGSEGQGWKYEEYINNGGHYDGYYFIKNATDKGFAVEEALRQLCVAYNDNKTA